MGRSSQARDLDRLRRSTEPDQLSADAGVKRPGYKPSHDERGDGTRGGEDGFSTSTPTRHRSSNTDGICANRLGDVFDAVAAERSVF